MADNLATICYDSKHKFAKDSDYPCGMLSKHSIRATLATNLDMLMRLRNPRWTQTELAKKTGVSQRTISNMLAGNSQEKSGATLDRVEEVAKVFGLRGWHLIMPELPNDIEQAKIMSDVITDYILADDDGRELIYKIAEREAEYKKGA